MFHSFSPHKDADNFNKKATFKYNSTFLQNKQSVVCRLFHAFDLCSYVHHLKLNTSHKLIRRHLHSAYDQPQCLQHVAQNWQPPKKQFHVDLAD